MKASSRESVQMLLILVCQLMIAGVYCFRKVLVPSVYKEYRHVTPPDWITSTAVQEKFGYSLFMYQKLHPKEPNYIPFNRGTEAGVYLRYIVDHYHQFPDIAVFVHAHPEDHNSDWLNAVKCVRHNASFMSLHSNYLTRDTSYWNFLEHGYEMWIEQCWREVLKVVWGLEEDISAFNKRVPITAPVAVNFTCCQQFILSRSMVHRRPLTTWKKLLVMIGEQNSCKVGEPDYDNLYSFVVNNRTKIGPEPETFYGGPNGELPQLYGISTQGGAMEHLAHVVYGHQPLAMPQPTMSDICAQFYPSSVCGAPSPCQW